jgi:hypothetical protein
MMTDSSPEPWPDTAPLLTPGKGIKFAVVDDATGNQSSVWRVWTSKNRDDVYLLEVRTGPTWKVSHHNEGAVWRIAMTKEGAAQLELDRRVGLLRLRLTSFMRDEVPRGGCRYAEEVSAGVQG